MYWCKIVAKFPSVRKKQSGTNLINTFLFSDIASSMHHSYFFTAYDMILMPYPQTRDS